jgi:DNA-binding NarL/FixJ family response regulator
MSKNLLKSVVLKTCSHFGCRRGLELAAAVGGSWLARQTREGRAGCQIARRLRSTWTPARAAARSSEVTRVPWSPLTAREKQVARLVARGFSDRRIAAELVVTEATAAKHVENIREKLSLNSRTQVGMWVRDHANRSAGAGS